MTVIPKAHRVRSTALRQSARGERCTLRLHGICDGGGETTVLAHLRMLGGGGVGLKPSDLSAVYACGPCHDALDGRRMRDEWGAFQILTALDETHRRMAERGLLRVHGAVA